MHGFTFITFLAVFGGLLSHAMKQYLTAQRAQSGITLKTYYVGHIPETVIAIACAFALWGGLPEIATNFPDLASSFGLSGEPGILSSFACGFVSNSLADVLGTRAAAISAKAPG